MSASINLQAIVLRLRAGIIAAQNQHSDDQINNLMESLNLLIDVAYKANNRQIAALLESLLDAARDIIHGVSWKSKIPSVEAIVTMIPADTTSAAGTTTQASLLRNFLVSIVTAWAQTAYSTDQIQVSFSDQLPATTYGDNTFAWMGEIQIEQLLQSFPIEVALDVDGCMSVNRIAT